MVGSRTNTSFMNMCLGIVEWLCCGLLISASSSQNVKVFISLIIILYRCFDK